jgi:hypothetical protein
MDLPCKRLLLGFRTPFLADSQVRFREDLLTATTTQSLVFFCCHKSFSFVRVRQTHGAVWLHTMSGVSRPDGTAPSRPGRGSVKEQVLSTLVETVPHQVAGLPLLGSSRDMSLLALTVFL